MQERLFPAEQPEEQFGPEDKMANPAPAKSTASVLTVGHSNRSLEDMLALLQAHTVSLVLDIRKIPRSRTNPQFNSESFAQSLESVQIGYQHLPALGGLRRPTADSPNAGWKNMSFRAYADYMMTAEFEEGLKDLLAALPEQRAALMCAEAVPWRCHRSLVADALVVRGIPVEHILSATRLEPHVIKAWARVQGTQITYPGANQVDKPEHFEGR